MFKSIARWLLRSKLSQVSPDTPKDFLSWAQINSIGLIISKDSALNRNALDKWISDTKKFVEVFYIETSAKVPSFGDWYCFTKKDKSLFELPKKSIEQELHDKKYDLVINTASAKDLFAAAVLIAIKAPYKCAASPELQDANLIVSPSVEGNLIHQLQDTMRYLQMIRKV